MNSSSLLEGTVRTKSPEYKTRLQVKRRQKKKIKILIWLLC